MLGRALRGLSLWMGLLVILTGAHMALLYGLNAIRVRYEAHLEMRLGTDAVDREPPYSPGERWIVALDIQPSQYWQEALGMSAVMSLIVAVFVGMGALVFKKRGAAKIALVALMVNGLIFYFFALLSEQIFAGYLLGRPSSAIVPAILVGIVQGVLSAMVLGGR